MIVIMSIDFLSHLKTVTSVISGLKCKCDSRVLLSDLSPSDWGTYRCSAHNDLGDASPYILAAFNPVLEHSKTGLKSPFP